MRVLSTFILSACLTLLPLRSQAQADCEAGVMSTKSQLGVSRIVEIDTTSGALFGKITRLESEPSILRPKEVILTFDDGPAPTITLPILKALAKHCTKATFFPVGKMALAYPDIIRQIRAQGHTIGAHTFSHPPSLPRLPLSTAASEIDRGFAAVALAAGGQVAPIFRYPGLNDSNSLMLALQRRGIAAFTVDVVSNDSFAPDATTLVEQTIKRIEARDGGIVLFHDIKPVTAKALPQILDRLKALGYQVVHARTKYQLRPPEKELVALTKRLSTSRLNTATRAGVSKPEQTTDDIITGTTGLTAITGAPSRDNAKPGDDSDAQPFQFIRSQTATKAILSAIGPPVTKIQPDPRKRNVPRAKPKPAPSGEPAKKKQSSVSQTKSAAKKAKKKKKSTAQAKPVAKKTAKKKQPTASQSKPAPKTTIAPEKKKTTAADESWTTGIQLPGG